MLSVKIMAHVPAKGQALTDTFIGVYGPSELILPEQTIELDGRSENLPPGNYTADITFYPRWGAENGTEQAKTMQQEIIVAVDVTPGGSGESRDQVDQRTIAQNGL